MILTKNEDAGQFSPYVISSATMPSYRAILQVWWISKQSIFIMLTSSSDNILNKQKDAGQLNPNAIPSKVMPCYNYSASLENHDIWYWFINLTSSSGTNNTLSGIGTNYVPPAIMPHYTCYSSLESLVNQYIIPIGLSHQQAHLALIMSLKWTMKMKVNLIHIQQHPRPCHVTDILQLNCWK